MSFSTPILLIAFNRPVTTAQVFAVIKKLQPDQLFIALDGARNQADQVLCAEVQKIIQAVDWVCDLHYLVQEQNLGVKQAGPTAINWFFDQVEEGIILEDDCLPDLSFFAYCAELLKHYRHDERVWHISGDHFHHHQIGSATYYFSQIPHIWGWATWRRAWRHYDIAMPDFPSFASSQILNQLFPTYLSRLFWLDVFHKNYLGLDNGWDFQWSYALMRHQALAINPNTNLISNIGFGAGAAHASQATSPHANLPTQSISLPIRHPRLIIADKQADEFIMRNNFGVTWHNFFLKHLLRRLSLFDLVKKLYYRFNLNSK